jgi:hypothetical protein
MFSKPGTLAVVCLATAMLMLDIAVVNTALRVKRQRVRTASFGQLVLGSNR